MRIAIYDEETGIVAAVLRVPDEVDAAAAAASWGRAWALAGDDMAPGWVLSEGTFAAPPPVPPSAAELKEHLKALRKSATRVIAAEIDIGGGPETILFDGESEDLGPLAHILALINAGAMPDPFMFRGGGVSRLLSHAQFMAAYLVAFPIVQAAYTAQGDLEAAIDAGTITDFAGLEAAFAAALE